MPKRFFALAAVVLAVISGVSHGRLLPDGNFHLQVLDVGQGDAVLVTTPKGARILVDGGPGDNVLRALSETSSYFNRRIDLIILTHPDVDHITGLIPVLKRYKVSAVLRTEAKKDSATFRAFEQEIDREQDIKIDWADLVEIDEATKFTVLWPPEGYAVSANKINETSVVSRLEFKGYKFLLTGDIGEATESNLVSTVGGDDLSSQVLKVPHHGSKYSSMDQFLRAVSPKIAVIGVGADNTYGHPTPEALKRLEGAGSRIFRTDMHGTVGFTVDERGLVVSTSK